MSDCSVTDVETVTSNDSFISEGQIVSWAEDCDGLVDSLSIVIKAEEETWEFDERSMTWECSGQAFSCGTVGHKSSLGVGV